MSRPHLAIGMQTAWRPQGSISATVVGLRSAGFSDTVHVFAEPDVTEQPELPDCTWHARATQLGCFQNWLQGLTWLHKELDPDWILMCQDDVTFRTDAASQLRKAQKRFPKAGVLSLYTSTKSVPQSYRNNPRNPPEHWREAQFWDKGYVGALALCFPRSSLRKFLATPRVLKHTHHRKVDVIVGNTLRLDLHLPILVHLPSLADHTGNDYSTLGRHKFPALKWGRRGYKFRAEA